MNLPLLQRKEPSMATPIIADPLEQFRDLPPDRIRRTPAPGTATEDDLLDIYHREKRLCELVDGVLVEKTVGCYESYLAVLIARLLGNYVAQHKLGVVLGADGMLRLKPGHVRIPDVSFTSWQRLGSKRVPRGPFGEFAADLAVEVISPSNTRQEMDRKLRDYFSAGTLLVWYVYPIERTVHVFTSPKDPTVLDENGTLEGSNVLPGFLLPLRELFAEPESS
jgi:Uma2 family endonuclease